MEADLQSLNAYVLQLEQEKVALMEQLHARSKSEWRCFWCDFVFTDRDSAERHFGKPFGGQDRPACAASDHGELIKELEKAHTLYGNSRYLSRLHQKVIAFLKTQH